MKTLSVVITAFNEEKNIKDCLESVSFADEIIVVDNSSSDKTVEIAKKFTKKVFTQKNDPSSIDLQKNLAIQKATSDWILILDADERVTAELKHQIEQLLTSEATATAYEMPRKNIIFGKWIEHSLWWPDYQRRLVKKGKGKYTEQNVHKQLQVEGEVGRLETPLLHENYQSLSQYLQKMDTYTENEAQALVSQNTHMHWSDAVNLPVRDFLKTFFLQQGYKDGLHGFVLSSLQAFYAFLVFAKVWEKQGFKEENDTHFLKTLFMTWQTLQKEIAYWFLTTFAQSSKNPVKKLSLLVRRKVLRTDKK